MRIGSLDKVACAEHGKERSAQNMVMIRNKVTNAVLWRCKPNSRCKSSHNERSRHTSEVEGIGQQDRPLQQGRGEVLLGQFSHGSVPARGDPPPPRHGEGQGRPIPGQSGMTFAPFPVLTMPFVRPQEYTLVPVNRESTALSTSPVQGDVFYVPTNPQGPYVTISNNSSHNSRQPNPFPNYPGGHPSGGGSFQGGSGLGY
ncbi:hypothetical protein AGDE_15661 [Angomonas deanei]|uniref:Uncharacterized protein n=1 Tax=Angomonas deanei TaxID=59799 RepID=A0A7G2CGM2_9TRYP|nr:hypothetical protein AGDE_15661 [Angomonas deanei]CAD2217843.1 hypothetical protein, conserved [Angomonas deanei]|eukprot:EPY18690.1 hypothetical protein AGDE_15661 [Angomonas deanei]